MPNSCSKMTENPYVFLISSGIARVGRAAVHDFYANHFLPQIPPDLEITSLSQTFGNDRIAEEMVIRFTHTIDMDWILPNVRPTGQRAEFVVAAIIQFLDGKVPTSISIGIRPRCCSRWASWIILWRR